MIYLYLLAAIILILAAITLLRIRIRLELSRQERLLFVGLGRSGPEFDLKSKEGSIRICGLRVMRLAPREERGPLTGKPPKPPKEKKKSRRYRPIGDILRLAPAVAKAVAGYALSVIHSFKVERLEGEIEGGFEQPDLTGTAYGFYQAAVGIAPATVGRLRFIPDWYGPSIDGWARISVAIPLYRLIARTIVLFFKLPLRDLIKLAIGRKKGDQDVQ